MPPAMSELAQELTAAARDLAGLLRDAPPEDGADAEKLLAACTSAERSLTDLHGAPRTAGPAEFQARAGRRHEAGNLLHQVAGYCQLLQAESAYARGAASEVLARIGGLVVRLNELLALDREQSLLAARGNTGPAEEPARSQPVAAEQTSPFGKAVPSVNAPQPGCVLVVDDDPSNREVLSRLLIRLGHEVRTAASGRAALELLESEDLDLVLLDLNMEELDGYHVLAQMQRDSVFREIPVIMVSAVDDVESVARCIEQGAADYLPKPFNFKLLQARVSACLARRRLHEQALEFQRSLKAAHRRAEEVLYDVFPHAIVEELKTTRDVRPQRHENVAVMFCDVVDFTAFCERRDPQEVVQLLRETFEQFEEIVAREALEKIKTIGDCFMATSGLLRRVDNPVQNCLRAAQEMLAANAAGRAGWQLRIGLHVGPVVAGLVGKKQYAFDLWGDTVNTAARVQAAARPGEIALSAEAWQHVADCCRAESMGRFDLKGKGAVEVYRFRKLFA